MVESDSTERNIPERLTADLRAGVGRRSRATRRTTKPQPGAEPLASKRHITTYYIELITFI
jgi:hypothetical protein